MVDSLKGRFAEEHIPLVPKACTHTPIADDSPAPAAPPAILRPALAGAA